MLHRPDALVEPEEIAEDFTILEDSGKVMYYGVGNHKPMQIELLSKLVKQPLIINQVRLSIINSGMIDARISPNMEIDPGMRERGYGRIINLTSGIADEPNLAVYSVSKAAVDKYSRDLAAEFKDENMHIFSPIRIFVTEFDIFVG